MKSKYTNTLKPLPELVNARAMARETMGALGEYARRDVRQWNLADIRQQIDLLETALNYFNATGTK